MHNVDIIEISSETSSPPVEHIQAARHRAARRKGKMKAADIIELTDDDSDSDVQFLRVNASQPYPLSAPETSSSCSMPRKDKHRVVVNVNSSAGDVDMSESRPLGSPSNTKDTPMSGVLNTDAFLSSSTNGENYTTTSDSPHRSPKSPALMKENIGMAGQELQSLSTPPTLSPTRLPKSSSISIPGPSNVPLPLVETPEEAMSRFVAQILEIVPDVDPEHCASLVADQYKVSDVTAERILHILLEDSNYPRVKKGTGIDKGKRKANGPGEGIKRPNKKVKGNGQAGDEAWTNDLWLSIERPFVGGIDYHTLALNNLQQNYPFIPIAFLREQLSAHKGFYAPTFFFLRKLQKGEIASHNHPYIPRKTPYKPPQGKGKHRTLADRPFEQELEWVKRMVDIDEGRGVADDEDANQANDANDSDEHEANESEGEDEENGIECGCCFSKFRFEKMIQCPDGHLFCNSCLRSYASTLLGSHNANITCMSQSTCTFIFPAAQLARVLPRKTYALYERLIQAKEIDAAGLVGLEECPFCEWKCVIEVGFEGEKLFRCGNEIGGCGVVSCRKCKKLDHLPKSCEEMEQDKKLDARHLVEEAMTQALMRNCPKCNKAFIKESGCNKMGCPNCGTLSCYICRQIITGYEHFNQNPHRPQTGSSENSSKCVLWDKDLEAFHANEVKNAQVQAIAEARLLHPEVSISDLKVDSPKAKKSNAWNAPNPNPNLGMWQAIPLPLPFMPRPPPPAPHPVVPGVRGVRAARGKNAGKRKAREVRVDPAMNVQQAHQRVPGQPHGPQPPLHPPLYHPQALPLAVPALPLALNPPMRGRQQLVDGGVENGGRVLRARGGHGEVAVNQPLRGVEIGGRMLRARGAHVEAVVNHPPVVGMAGGPARHPDWNRKRN